MDTTEKAKKGTLVYQLMTIHFIDSSNSEQNKCRILMSDMAFRTLKLGSEITPETKELSNENLIDLVKKSNELIELMGDEKYRYNPSDYI